MKRFHVHVSVESLESSIRFYSQLFGAEPSVVKADYAKWMIEDPRINFAISQRGHEAGVNHLGFQLDTDEELKAMHTQLAAADASLVEQTGAACCYARSDKYWVTDPTGIAWETYHTLDSVPVFGDDRVPEPGSKACCVPAPEVAKVAAKVPVKIPVGIPVVAGAGGACCAPAPADRKAEAVAGGDGRCCS